MVASDSGERKTSFFSLITELPHLLAQLIRAELELLRRELLSRLKATGVGIGLLIVALNLVLLFALLLVFAGVFALSLVMPLWAATLIVAAGVLILTLIVGGIGAAMVAGTKSLVPTRTIENVKEDIATIRGDRPSRRRSGGNRAGA